MEQATVRVSKKEAFRGTLNKEEQLKIASFSL